MKLEHTKRIQEPSQPRTATHRTHVTRAHCWYTDTRAGRPRARARGARARESPIIITSRSTQHASTVRYLMAFKWCCTAVLKAPSSWAISRSCSCRTKARRPQRALPVRCNTRASAQMCQGVFVVRARAAGGGCKRTPAALSAVKRTGWLLTKQTSVSAARSMVACSRATRTSSKPVSEL